MHFIGFIFRKLAWKREYYNKISSASTMQSHPILLEFQTFRDSPIKDFYTALHGVNCKPGEIKLGGADNFAIVK